MPETQSTFNKYYVMLPSQEMGVKCGRLPSGQPNNVGVTQVQPSLPPFEMFPQRMRADRKKFVRIIYQEIVLFLGYRLT